MRTRPLAGIPLLVTAATAAVSFAGPSTAHAMGDDIVLSGCESLSGSRTVQAWLVSLTVTLDDGQTDTWTNDDVADAGDRTVTISFDRVEPGVHTYTVTDTNAAGHTSAPVSHTVTVPACPTTTTTSSTTVSSTSTDPTVIASTTPQPVIETPTTAEIITGTPPTVPTTVPSSTTPTTAVEQTTTTGTTNTLPATGANNAPLIGAGFAFLVLGSLATSTARRRKGATS